MKRLQKLCIKCGRKPGRDGSLRRLSNRAHDFGKLADTFIELLPPLGGFLGLLFFIYGHHENRISLSNYFVKLKKCIAILKI